MVFPHRMENALARAEELLAVGQQSTAIQLLYDAITSRHFQHNLLALEPIVTKFIELCVELRQGKLAKDGLSQYRAFSQATNMQAFEQAVRRFVKLTEERLEQAQKSADSHHGPSEEAVDPAVEEIAKMLQAQLAFESGKSIDRQTVLPWKRFVWEALRAAIEVCRNNVKLERLYSDLVFKAFDYCIRFQRKAELKRLAETLRYHLMGIVKSAASGNQQFAIILTGEAAGPDSQQIQLDIRYRQLDVALEMELWQEAFRSIEDIHGLFLLGGKSTEQLLCREEYFEKVARIFAMSENTLFYSAALIRRFLAFKGDNGSVKEAVKKLGAVSLLAVPLGSAGVNDSVLNNGSWSYLEDQHGRASRLAYFLGLESPPTLTSLLHEVLHLGLGDCKLEELLQVYLSLDYSKCCWSYVNSMYQFVTGIAGISTFLPAITNNIIFLHLKYLESRASVFTLSSMQSEFIALFDTSIDLLQLLIKWTRSGDIAVSIDMVKDSVCFNPQASLFADPSPVFFDFEDPRTVYLHQLCSMLHARSSSAFVTCRLLFEKLEAAKREAQRRIEAAERAREEREAQRKEREKEEAKERVARLAAEQEAEERRLTEEAAKRERERMAKEREALRKQEQKKKEEEEKRLAELSGVRANLERLQQLSVRLDHIERALRTEELPLLESDYQQQLVADREAYQRRVGDLKESCRRAFESDRQAHTAIQPFTADIDVFVGRVRAKREQDLQAIQSVLNRQYAEARAMKLAELADKKKQQPVITNLAAAIEATLETGAADAVRTEASNKHTSPHLAAESGPSTGSWRRPSSPMLSPRSSDTNLSATSSVSEPAPKNMDEEQVRRMKVSELKEVLSVRGLSTTGRKEDLVQRLLTCVDDTPDRNVSTNAGVNTDTAQAKGQASLDDILKLDPMSVERMRLRQARFGCTNDVLKKAEEEETKARRAARFS